VGHGKQSCHEEGWVKQKVVGCTVLCSTLSFSYYFISLRPIRFSSETTRCHTRFLRPKPDAHRMYAQDQVVIHMVRM
jgi:hypothetical protein